MNIEYVSSHAKPMLGIGHTWHKRVKPLKNAFKYDTYFLYLPLRSMAAQPSLAKDLPRNRRGLLSFYDRDHGLGEADSLAWFEGILLDHGIMDADGEVWLQTLPRVLGYAFKPVSFWYAHRQDGGLVAVLAEVNNTFGERHCYLLHGDTLIMGRDVMCDKVFHVSPFLSVSGQYTFRFVQQNDLRSVRLTLTQKDEQMLLTSWSGRLIPYSADAARATFFRTPMMGVGIVFKIHWQALKLFLTRVPFFSQPKPPKEFLTK